MVDSSDTFMNFVFFPNSISGKTCHKFGFSTDVFGNFDLEFCAGFLIMNVSGLQALLEVSLSWISLLRLLNRDTTLVKSEVSFLKPSQF
jgi:hypothetical protein